jgi:hypothetical protein
MASMSSTALIATFIFSLLKNAAAPAPNNRERATALWQAGAG